MFVNKIVYILVKAWICVFIVLLRYFAAILQTGHIETIVNYFETEVLDT